MGKGAIKAFMKNVDTGVVQKFMYNPESFSDSISIKFSEIGSVGGSYFRYQYVSGGNRSVSLQLWMRDTNSANIDKVKNFIEDFIPSRSKRFATPPLMLFSFGKYIKKFAVEGIARDWKEFNPDLTLKEMTITLTLKEVV